MSTHECLRQMDMSTITIKEVGFKNGGYNNQDLNIRLKQHKRPEHRQTAMLGDTHPTSPCESSSEESLVWRMHDFVNTHTLQVVDFDLSSFKRLLVSNGKRSMTMARFQPMHDSPDVIALAITTRRVFGCKNKLPQLFPLGTFCIDTLVR